MDVEFTLCRNETTGGEALLATEALGFWATKGWKPVEPEPQTPAPKKGRKPAAPGDNTGSE
jgi:hypothetical protein